MIAIRLAAVVGTQLAAVHGTGIVVSATEQPGAISTCLLAVIDQRQLMTGAISPIKENKKGVMLIAVWQWFLVGGGHRPSLPPTRDMSRELNVLVLISTVRIPLYILFLATCLDS